MLARMSSNGTGRTYAELPQEQSEADRHLVRSTLHFDPKRPLDRCREAGLICLRSRQAAGLQVSSSSLPKLDVILDRTGGEPGKKVVIGLKHKGATEARLTEFHQGRSFVFRICLGFGASACPKA